MKNLINQIMKFGVVGFLCFFIDFGILFLLTDIFKVNHLISAPISFTISVIVNYILSIKWVFDVNDKNKKLKFILFIVFSVIGLLMNELIMYIGVDKLLFNYLLVKIFSTAVVMVFNFITRKMFLENI